MKGYISIEIPTKSYIKAYLLHRFQGKVLLNQENVYGNKLYDLLQHPINEEGKRFSTVRYNDRMRVYISRHVFMHRGCHLNETNIKNFNNFVEDDIKDKYRFLMDIFVDINPTFQQHLESVRRHLGIDIDAWSDDSMKKDYYRYRKSMGKPMLYAKKRAATVPSETPHGIAF